MVDNVDVRVTPALHPDNIEAIDGYDDEVAGIVSSTKAAFADAYAGIGQVHDARAAAAQNPTWNEAEQIIQTQDFADKIFSRVAKRFDGAAAQLQMLIGGIEKEFSTPIEVKASNTLAGEIRRHVAKLPSEERMGFIRRAITGNDERTATAILGAPSYLSGITPEIQETLTRIYHEHHHPLQAKRLKVAKGALALVHERAGLVFGQLEKAVGVNARKVAQLRQSKNAAQAAFVLKVE